MINPERYNFLDFDFVEMKLDKFSKRRFILTIKESIDEFDRKHTILLRYNTDQFEDAITDLHMEKEKERAKCIASLIHDRTLAEIDADYGQQIRNAEDRLQEVINENQDIQFGVNIWKVEYKNWFTKCSLHIINPKVPNEINEISRFIHKYKIAILERK